MIEDILSKRDAAWTRRQAAVQNLATRRDLTDLGKKPALDGIVATYDLELAELRRQATERIEGERQRLAAARTKAQADAIKRLKALYADVPPSLVLVLERQVAGSTVAELGDLYERLAVDPAMAQVLRDLLAARLPSMEVPVADYTILGRLQRRIDDDRAAAAPPALAQLDAEAIDLQRAERELGALDPAGRAAELNQRFNIGAANQVPLTS